MKKLMLVLALLATGSVHAKSVDERVEDLLKRMTLKEKASLSAGLDNMHSRAIPRLGIPELRMTDGPNGVRWDKTTAFPTGIVLAASWDLALADSMGKALARESKGRGRNVLLGPCININRHPFGGRNFESYGEDPWLTSRLGVTWVNALQAQGIGASTKHFAANNQETLRDTIDAKVDERSLREIYLPAFEAAVKEANTATIMVAYNRLNGAYCSANDILQNKILKDEWGFKGLVVSDWGATHEGAGAARGGLDLEMPGPGRFMGDKLVAEVEQGRLAESVVTEQARRILRVTLELGLMEKPSKEDASLVNTKENQAVARAIAEGGAVLLKNERQALPLDLTKIKRLAVVGPSAATARVGGGGSSQIAPPYAVSPLQGLRERLKGKVEILYAQGTEMDEEVETLPASALRDVKAEYFDNKELKGTAVLTRAEKRVNFDWGLKSPSSKIAKDNFSARIKGTLIAPVTGDLRLGCRGDDGYRLKLDGKLIVDNWTEHAAETKAGVVSVVKGKSYAFELEYFESAGDASISLGWQVPRDHSAEALAAAKAADAVLVFVGLSDHYESEGSDRKDFSLPGGQNELILAMTKVNKHVVVVMQSGSPVNVEPWIGQVGALLQAWFPGMEGGNALAALLVGDKNPSGKLPVTFPKRLVDVPSNNNFPGDGKIVRYEEGIFVGYRYYDTKNVEPRFAFGHGLSYTTFQYSDLNVVRKGTGATVTFTLKNTGSRAGAEVAQLYVSPPKSALPRPKHELKAFDKIKLEAGESRTVTLNLNERSFQYWSPAKAGWTADAGTYGLAIGSSSRDMRLNGNIQLP